MSQVVILVVHARCPRLWSVVILVIHASCCMGPFIVILFAPSSSLEKRLPLLIVKYTHLLFSNLIGTVSIHSLYRMRTDYAKEFDYTKLQGSVQPPG